MTVRVKISHMEPDAVWDLTVQNTFFMEVEVITLIKAGGSHEFFIHSAKNLVIKEISNKGNKKSGEAEASPS